MNPYIQQQGLKSAFLLHAAVGKLTFYYLQNIKKNVIPDSAIASTPTITTRTADDHCLCLQVNAKQKRNKRKRNVTV